MREPQRLLERGDSVALASFRQRIAAAPYEPPVVMRQLPRFGQRRQVDPAESYIMAPAIT